MLYYLFVTLYVLVCFLLIVVILLQQGKGGDIASAFGGGGGSQAVFGARAGATLLTRVTTGLAALFIVLSVVLSVWGQQGPGSVVGGVEGPAPAPASPAQTTPAPPGSQPPAGSTAQPPAAQPPANAPAEQPAAPAKPPQ
jgi:preprotein translocase subunit SecG